jgi:hypothetical protein
LITPKRWSGGGTNAPHHPTPEMDQKISILMILIALASLGATVHTTALTIQAR